MLSFMRASIDSGDAIASVLFVPLFGEPVIDLVRLRRLRASSLGGTCGLMRKRIMRFADVPTNSSRGAQEASGTRRRSDRYTIIDVAMPILRSRSTASTCKLEVQP
jgi:hypothetical protein